jgi:hypothetical protein
LAAHSGVGDPDGGRWRRCSYDLTPDGSDTTVVTEIYDCSRAPEDVRTELDPGNVFIERMAKTPERLDALFSN